MPTARELAAAFERIAPLDSGVPGDELGFVFGDPDNVVRGVGCVWAVEARSIARCAARAINMIICHEGLWLPEQQSPWYDAPSTPEIFSNQARRDLLERHGMVVYRSHSNWDALPRDGVPDQAIAALGLRGLDEIARQKFFSVQRLPAPLTVDALGEHVRKGLAFSSCRIFGDGAKQVRQFAFLIGGFGENQYHMPQVARDLGAEVIVIGEMSEFIVIACLEMGLPVIETLHSASEIPALRRQADMLAACFPSVRVEYVPSGAAAWDQ